MAILKGYLKDKNGSFIPNSKISVLERSSGEILAETYSGDGTVLAYDDNLYNKTVLHLRMNNNKGLIDLSKNRCIINNTGVAINPIEGIVNDGCAVFNTSTYLRTNTINFTNQNLCMECYVKLLAYPTSDSWPGSWNSCFSVMGVGTSGSADGFNLCLGQTKIFLNNSNGMICSGNHNMFLNTWYHLEVIRNNTLLKTRINGQDIASYTISTSNVGTGAYFYIGCETAEGAYLIGYMNDLRVTLGDPRHIDTFTPNFKHFSYGLNNKGGPLGYYEINLDYIGDIDIIAQLPTSYGSYNDLIKRVKLL